ncbi:hypothetical protein ACS3UN_13380 [Oscillospiraceae bacterium LTW-04]|nr:hypothetical protein RBH76_01190 [Oscillospiraceae bacterium MB24-C1]
MKKALFYLPFITLIFMNILLIDALGIELFFGSLWLLVPFWASGVLLSRRKVWGSLFGCLPAAYFIYHGMYNWKSGQLEIQISIVLIAYYLVCGAAVFWQNLKKR